MRTLVQGQYDTLGNYVLRYETDDYGRKGEVHMTIEPGACFGIGNSMGGWWAKPITYGDQSMIALVRVSQSQRYWDYGRLSRRFGGERGFVLRPGMVGLWATSSGSARRGVFHPVRGEENNPVKRAVRAAGLPTRDIVLVKTFEDEKFSKYTLDCGHPHSCFCGGGTNVATDGQVAYSNTEKVTVGDPYIGRQREVEDVIYLATGGSYRVFWWWTRDSSLVSITRVMLTPAADLMEVASVIDAINRSSRWSVDKTVQDLVAAHQAKRDADKAFRKSAGIMF